MFVILIEKKTKKKQDFTITKYEILFFCVTAREIHPLCVLETTAAKTKRNGIATFLQLSLNRKSGKISHRGHLFHWEFYTKGLTAKKKKKDLYLNSFIFCIKKECLCKF